LGNLLSTRQQFTEGFHVKVVVEARKGHRTVNGIPTEFDFHSTQTHIWKKQLFQNAGSYLSGEMFATSVRSTTIVVKIFIPLVIILYYVL
jgi:hypothetical protein